MPRPLPKTKNRTVAISVKNLSFAYGDETVLQNISFDVDSGTIAAIIGPNGSGKTTLLKAILGLIKPDKGGIEILGQPLHHVYKAIGYVPQAFDFDRTFPITVREYLHLALHPQAKPDRIEKSLEEVKLPTSILHQTLGTLSGGQLQRVLIAQAILNDPLILILDEPSTGIDIIGEAAFNEVIQHLNKTHGTTVLLVSHDISMISKVVQQVICINKKLMCFGTPKQALTAKKLADVYGERATLIEHHH